MGQPKRIDRLAIGEIAYGSYTGLLEIWIISPKQTLSTCHSKKKFLYVFKGPFFAQLRRHKSMYNPKNLAELITPRGYFTLVTWETASVFFVSYLGFLRLKSGACALLPMAWPTPSTTGSRGSRSAVLAVLRRQGEQGSIAVVNLAGGVFGPEAKGWMDMMGWWDGA